MPTIKDFAVEANKKTTEKVVQDLTKVQANQKSQQSERKCYYEAAAKWTLQNGGVIMFPDKAVNTTTTTTCRTQLSLPKPEARSEFSSVPRLLQPIGAHARTIGNIFRLFDCIFTLHVFMEDCL